MSSYDVTVVIVSYNVKAFLHFCLNSVYKACPGLSVQIIVVDNASTDDSVSHITMTYPDVEVIQNDENLGFAKACNIGWRLAKAPFILFLNPDTVLSENVLKNCLEEIKTDDKIGALGVKMIDGVGTFLPESKRGRLTPLSALYKLSRISQLFPKSPHFNQYYLGHLCPEAPNDIECLTGAFFFTTREVLIETEGFDEQFFMYGEDIDLSYRIRQSNKRIVYLPSAQIIHFKGESTKKSSVKYFRDFYGAMIKFVKKHSRPRSWSFVLLLQFGIFLSTIAGMLTRFISQVFHPLKDAVVISAVLYGVSKIWAQYYHRNPDYFEYRPLFINIALCTFVWVGMMVINGVYRNRKKLALTIKSMIQGLLIILAVYALLGAGLRSSRAVILIGFSAVSLVLILLKSLGMIINRRSIRQKIHFWDTPSEALYTALMQLGYKKQNIVGRTKEYSLDTRGDLLIDSSKVSYEEMMETMSHQKIASLVLWDPNHKMIINSRDKNEKGNVLDEARLYQITHPGKKRSKRLFDLTAVFLLSLSLPLVPFLGKGIYNFLDVLLKIIISDRTLISYQNVVIDKGLPDTKEGYFFPLFGLSSDELVLLAKDYALHYSFFKDLGIFISHYTDIAKKLAKGE